MGDSRQPRQSTQGDANAPGGPVPERPNAAAGGADPGELRPALPQNAPKPHNTTSSIVWSGLTMLLIGSLLPILSRIVEPGDIGLLGMVVAFMGVMAGFAGLGLDGAIIQAKDVDAAVLSSAFWLSTLVGLALGGVGVAAAPLVGLFYHNDEVAEIMRFLPLIFVSTSMAVVPLALMKRRLQFNRIAIVELIFALVLVSVTVWLTLRGLRIWALIIGILAGTFVRAVVALLFARFRPRLVFSFARVRALIRFSLFYSGASAVNALCADFDYLMVGRYVGTTLLGYYTLAYSTIQLPLTKISAAVTSVMFPAFSRYQDDDAALRADYKKMVCYLLYITGSILMFIGFFAPEIITTIFSDKWLDSVRLIRILIVVGLLKSIGTTVGTIINAKGKTNISFFWNLFVLAVVAPAFYVGAKIVPQYIDINGAEAVAWTYSIVYTFLFFGIQHIANSLIGLSMREYFRGILPALKVLSLLTVLLFAQRSGLDAAGVALPAPVVFVGGAALNVGILAALLHWIDPGFLNTLMRKSHARNLRSAA